MLPAWFIQQFLQTTQEASGSGTAFSAHVGGFIYGAVFALLVKLVGFEEKYIAPVVEEETTSNADPRLVKAVAARNAR